MSDSVVLIINGVKVYEQPASGVVTPPVITPVIPEPPAVPPGYPTTPPVTPPASGYPGLGNPYVTHAPFATGIYAMPAGVRRGLLQLTNETYSPGMVYEVACNKSPGDFTGAQQCISSGGFTWSDLYNPHNPGIVIPLGEQWHLMVRRVSGDDNGLQMSWSPS
jgi:hypothetical protein